MKQKTVRIGLVTFVVAVALAFAPSALAQAPADIQKAVDAAYAKYKDLKEGKNADYIPGPREGRPEPVRHRRRHRRREGLLRG